MFLLIAGLQDVSSQDSIVPVFSSVGGRIGSTYCYRYCGLAPAVIHVFVRVCRTLANVQECFDAASRT